MHSCVHPVLTHKHYTPEGHSAYYPKWEFFYSRNSGESRGWSRSDRYGRGRGIRVGSGAGATNVSTFASIAGSPGAGKAFSFTNGVLSVVSAGVSPVLLTNSVVGGTNLFLSWPAGQGWRLEWQTNLLNKGLSTNWLEAAGSSVSSTNITIDKTKPTVFYRLVNP